MPLIPRYRDDARDVPLWGHVLLASALAAGFYVYLRSFPLLTEDGAFNYMSLLQRLNTERPFSLLFGFKLIEGLGQPNPFWSIAFDPFSWPMLLVRFGYESPQNYLAVFQLTMALRLIACWLGTYIFAAAAFPRARTVAITASYLNVCLSVLLATNFGATENHAGIPNVSQAALLPLLAGVYIRGINLGKPLVSANGLAVLVLLFFCIFSYPVLSLMGLVVLVGMAAAISVFGGPAVRRSASVHLVGLLAAIGLIMLLPGLDAYASWQAFAKVSSRIVFADELQPVFKGYVPPSFWYTPPFASRLIVLFAVAGLLVIDRVPPIARSIMAASILMVGGIQLVGLASTLPIFAEMIRPLPPLGRVETFFPPLYAFSAAVALYAAERVLVARSGWRFALWCGAALVLAGSAVYIFGVAYEKFGWAGLARSPESDLVVVFVVALLGLALLYNALRLYAPRLLPAALLQPAGPIRAGRGPAETLHNAVSYGFVALVVVFAAHMWLTNALYIGGYVVRYAVCDRMTVLGCRDTDVGRGLNAGFNPVVDFLRTRLTSSEDFAGRAEYLSPYDVNRLDPSAMISERSTNFGIGNNGMMLGSLTFQGVPVASTYEQSHDYLYYLFWTRYLMQNAHFRFSPNWTALYQFLPGPLALAGVRYVVTRRANRQALGSAPIVFTWKDYVVAELAGANTQGYGVTRIVTAATIADALSFMRGPAFDPRRAAVLSEADRRRLPGGDLQPVASSEIATRRQTVHLTARSAGQASLIVLPFRFSHCWVAQWNGPPGTLLRVDAALLAVYFEGTVDASLAWTGGYGALSRCLVEDASLIEEARAAARQIPN